ncbi:proline dehydrogenase 1, mitochondrial [Plakobranchus ocellatus]|uniref:Proline dehydrogenase n=1 Tax=Plakobranchus ocellatus TaxID=259542 RepID=A0AAV4A755_9GAST|nr:proline dehydrogenase 1, mitochondrial [Plakobranchus ocellatus]
MPGWESFPIEKTEEFQVGLRRVGKLNSELEKHDIIALTDAEYTCMNPALRLLGLASMKQCNSGDKAKVFYTYQAYLKSKAEELADDIRFAKTSGFAMGVKLVRGAYMVQERQRAKQGGYPDPVNPDYETTSRSYDSCLNLLLNEAALTASEQHELQDGEASSKAKASGKPGGIRFIIASHNEDSVLYALQRMKDLRIPKDCGTVFFGQLYGMADHVSFVLGMGGYSVYKSIPYGSIGETLPYLARRAQENKAILTNARRERNLIMKTLKDRALLRG